MHTKDDNLLAFAGLYEFCADPTVTKDHEVKWRMICTILTTTGKDAVRKLPDSIPESSLVPRVVSAEMGPVRNNGPEPIGPVTAWTLPESSSAAATHMWMVKDRAPSSIRLAASWWMLAWICLCGRVYRFLT